MRTAHIVGENLKFRFGVDHRLVGEDQVLVGLLRIGLLGVFADDDAAIENRARSAIQDAFVQLVAAAIRLGVIDDRVIVNVLSAVEIGRASCRERV